MEISNLKSGYSPIQTPEPICLEKPMDLVKRLKQTGGVFSERGEVRSREKAHVKKSACLQAVPGAPAATGPGSSRPIPAGRAGRAAGWTPEWAGRASNRSAASSQSRKKQLILLSGIRGTS